MPHTRLDIFYMMSHSDNFHVRSHIKCSVFSYYLKEMDIIWNLSENLLQEFPEVGCLCKTCFARCGGEMKTKGNWEHCLRWGWTQMKTLWYYWTLLCINHSRGRSFRNIWNCHRHDILRAPKDLSFSRSVLFQICPISQGWQWPILEWGEHLS